MIRRTLLPLPALLAFSVFASAQTLVSNKHSAALIRSDNTSQSTLITSMTDQRGDRSQVFATGVMQTNDKSVLCRSLLAFDYSRIPARFRSEDIQDAKLILFPLQMENEDLAGDKRFKGEIVVKRIIDPWNDSLTTWTNQPAADEHAAVTKKINTRKKDGIVEIDVTKQVKQMMKEGNYGFMISSNPGEQKVSGVIHWFASARNEQMLMRPLLVIKYPVSQIAELTAKDTMTARTPLSDRRFKEADEEYDKVIRTLTNKSVKGVPVSNTTGPRAPIRQ